MNVKFDRDIVPFVRDYEVPLVRTAQLVLKKAASHLIMKLDRALIEKLDRIADFHLQDRKYGKYAYAMVPPAGA